MNAFLYVCLHLLIEMGKKIYISVLFVLMGLKFGFSQEKKITVSPEFFVKVKVIDKSTQKPIQNATLSINGITFSYSYKENKYIIKARAGDELVVTHPDFENVYYTIKDNEDIKVEVKDFVDRRRGVKKPIKKKTASFDSKVLIKEEPEIDLYNTFLDSAKYYKEKSIDKSLSFIQNILSNKETDNRNAATYSTLANIYMFWKQYDLAITNYINSLNFRDNPSIQILLGQAYAVSKKYKEAENTFKRVLKRKLTKFEQIIAHEGLGDAYLGLKNYKRSRESYEEGLRIAIVNTIKSKVTDLNSKLGDVFAAQGNIILAKKSFNNSINSAKSENLSRSLKEKDKVADFLNMNSQFDDEIKLRKESLKEFSLKDSLIKNDSIGNIIGPSYDGLQYKKDSKGVIGNNEYTFSDKINIITPQSINYKIGRAYTQKEDYRSAIPFLQKSIDEPDKDGDLEIKKDATRKLSETFAAVGEFDKALKSYQDYVGLVDQTYIQKEQEIAQAKRFAKKIADNQNRIASLEKDKAFRDTKIDLAYKDQQLSEEQNRNQLIVIYSLIAGLLGLVAVAYLLFRSNRQQKLANNLLALKSMRSQMNPHFIFNALNSVNSFIAVNDERNANRYLSEFSVLMRSVLENSDEDFIPLSKEIELLELYVKLEHNRFKDKFEYTIDVDKSIDLDQFSIPPMLLQPYIENAIWHGLRYKKEMGKLSISIEQKNVDAVAICIEDDGVGRKKSMELKTKNQLKQKSKGMSTIKNRVAILNDMYQDRILVEVSDLFANGEGTKVELLLRKS